MPDVPKPYRSKTPEQALAHLVEEAGEVLAAAGKTLRFGFQSVNPELPPERQETNLAWLRREMADLDRAMDAFEHAVSLAELRARPAEKMADRLRLNYINSLPQPFMLRMVGAKETWPVVDIDVETGLLRFDVCGKLQTGHISNVAEFIDADGQPHDPDTFYTDYEAAADG